jgi:hypothetical protein
MAMPDGAAVAHELVPVFAARAAAHHDDDTFVRLALGLDV